MPFSLLFWAVLVVLALRRRDFCALWLFWNFGSGEIEERAAAAVLRLERLPFDEVSLGPPVTNVTEILAPCTVVLVVAVVLLWLGIIYEINHGRCTKMHFLWSLAQKHRWA